MGEVAAAAEVLEASEKYSQKAGWSGVTAVMNDELKVAY